MSVTPEVFDTQVDPESEGWTCYWYPSLVPPSESRSLVPVSYCAVDIEVRHRMIDTLNPFNTFERDGVKGVVLVLACRPPTPEEDGVPMLLVVPN